MVVNNPKNINKTNNHISLNLKKTTINGTGNPGPGLGRAYKCGGIKLVPTEYVRIDNVQCILLV